MYDDSSNYSDGAFIDPPVAYGPRAGTMARLDDSADVQAEPIIGGTAAVSAKGPTVAGFFRSPVGWLLILLALAYVAFDRVFGDGGVGE